MRIAIYARVSTTDQADALGAQLDRLRARARERWPHAHLVEYVETGSGKDTARDQLQQVLREVKRGRIDVVLVERIDRLSRSLVDSIHLLDRLATAGCALVTLDFAIDTSTATGRVAVQLLQVLAQWERDLLLERSRRGTEAAKARGVVCHRPPTTRRLDLAEVGRLRSLGWKWDAIAAQCGVSRFALRRALAAAGENTTGPGRAGNRAIGGEDSPADPARPRQPKRARDRRTRADGG